MGLDVPVTTADNMCLLHESLHFPNELVPVMREELDVLSTLHFDIKRRAESVNRISSCLLDGALGAVQWTLYGYEQADEYFSIALEARQKLANNWGAVYEYADDIGSSGPSFLQNLQRRINRIEEQFRKYKHAQ
jgi:hypothetical protein